MVDALGSEVKRVTSVKGVVSDTTRMVPEPGVPPVKPFLLMGLPATLRPVIEGDGIHWKHSLDQKGEEDSKPKNGSQQGTCEELEDDRSIGGHETTK